MSTHFTPEQIDKIYLDLDGVMADFFGKAAQVIGKTTYTEDELWTHMRQIPNVFGTLSLMPGAKALFDEIYQTYGARCEILSAIPLPQRGITTAEADKRAWVPKYLSPTIKINIVHRKAYKQQFCTGKNCILIDDFQCNIDDWTNAGGTGIIHTDALSTREKLIDLGVLTR